MGRGLRNNLRLLQCFMVSSGRERTHTFIEKTRARSPRCCDQALYHVLVLNIGLPSFHLFPWDRIVQEKIGITMTMTASTLLRSFGFNCNIHVMPF